MDLNDLFGGGGSIDPGEETINMIAKEAADAEIALLAPGGLLDMTKSHVGATVVGIAFAALKQLGTMTMGFVRLLSPAESMMFRESVWLLLQGFLGDNLELTKEQRIKALEKEKSK